MQDQTASVCTDHNGAGDSFFVSMTAIGSSVSAKNGAGSWMERVGAMLRSGPPFRATSRGEEDTTPVIDSFQEGSKKTQARKSGPSSLASTASQSVSRTGRFL